MIVSETRVAAALPGYELGAQLGQGASGLVLAGRHRELHRDVAIKILAVGSDGTVGRSQAEARLLAALDHPHIVRVFDAVIADDLHMIVMELLGGGTLARRRADLPAETACAVVLAVAAALSYAHGRGVLHRDIKPGNILFDTAGLAKVADFGIAKIMGGPAATASAVVGTPRYMAPEQFRSGRLSAATDLYALGVVLYELLAGAPLFDPALTVPELIQHHLTVLPPPPPEAPAPLAEVVMRALVKDPAGRPPSARAFALDLARAGVEVYGPGWAERTGLVLRLDDDIRAAVGRVTAPSRPAPPPPSPPPPPPPAGPLAGPPSAPSHGHSDLPTHHGAAPVPSVRPDRATAGPPRRPGRDGSGRRRRLLPVTAAFGLLAVVVAVILLSKGWPENGGPPTTAPSASPVASQSPEQVWRSIYNGLNVARSRAFEQADEAALTDSCAAGSGYIASEGELMRQMVSRGAHSSPLRTEIINLQVRVAEPDRTVLRVTQRLDAYDFLDAQDRVLAHQPAKTPERRDVVMVRTDAGWRVSDNIVVTG